ncbi:MAG: hypothetical protein M1816_001016 [Peltula sp. TS41687]|nr:MAG: hypothetical protein M1816_001016 [Peltula sp. TS41687]
MRLVECRTNAPKRRKNGPSIVYSWFTPSKAGKSTISSAKMLPELDSVSRETLEQALRDFIQTIDEPVTWVINVFWASLARVEPLVTLQILGFPRLHLMVRAQYGWHEGKSGHLTDGKTVTQLRQRPGVALEFVSRELSWILVGADIISL